MSVDYFKKYLFSWIFVYMFADALAVTCGWVFAYWLRFNLGLPYPVEDNPFFLYMTVAGIIPLPAVLCFMQAGFYHSRRMDKFHVGYITLIKGILYLMIVILAVLFFFRTVSFSRIFALYFMTGTFIFISLFRYGVRQINRYALMRSPRRRRILIVGNGRTAKNLIEKIRANRIFGFRIIGTIATSQTPVIQSDKTIEEIPALLEQNSVDEVFIALDIEDAGLQREINRVLSDVHVDINFVPDIYHSINLNPAIIDFSGIPVMVLRQSPLYGWNRLVKRLFDITGALTGILIFSIPMLITAVLIRLHSKGSVIYKQRRTGLDGVDFHIYKFRSMRTDAEIQSGAVWAVKNDDRTTPIGKIIRRTSIDELPQFFNVLRGEMSLVGPRPERPEFIRKFRQQIPNYTLRHKVQAGITGWAQINGWRGNTSLEKRIEYDLYYITNWSVWFDIKIILLTFVRGFVNPNAY